MRSEIQKLFDDAGINPLHHISTRAELTQISIATSLKRIADNLDLVINHNTFPSTSISVSQCSER